MQSFAHRSETIQNRLARWCCPDCASRLIFDTCLHCESCARQFSDEQTGMIDLTPSQASENKNKIATFWGDIYKQWYASDDATMTMDRLRQELGLLKDLFRKREHLAVIEMQLDQLTGKHVLEIGSGAGGHSALFAAHGAQMTSIDITPERVMSTNLKFDLLRHSVHGDGIALRADAETLPFDDHSFDIVYSNGVLHHTENTNRGIDEVFRVLKPGGQAVLMLYARSSAFFWLMLLPKGIVRGEAFRLPEAEWLGRATEGAPRFRGERNPYTRVYNRAQLMQLLHKFSHIQLRKSAFTISQLPIPGIQRERERILAALGHRPHEGGRLIYGSPFTPETSLELALGRHIGFAWNIRAQKPTERA
ncbi:MAG: methyltransferase domain-containing protein [Chloroflexi bacterium]|nr:methyltransferase domain-containing protein [Chloroflexota bacterium]